MGYKFLHDGTFAKCNDGAEHLYGAVLQRLEDLLGLISDEAELEVDYDSVGDKWIAMEYFPEKEYAIELADTAGNLIVGFSGVPHDIMVDILNKSSSFGSLDGRSINGCKRRKRLQNYQYKWK